tara:strand:- start:494 stop:700 length:207 start_codon:yes stop_codon:yes gene_type:complete
MKKEGSNQELWGFESYEDLVEDYLEDSPPVVDRKTPVPAIKETLKYFPLILVANKGKIVGAITAHNIF